MKINTFIIGLFISSICFGERTPSPEKGGVYIFKGHPTTLPIGSKWLQHYNSNEIYFIPNIPNAGVLTEEDINHYLKHERQLTPAELKYTQMKSSLFKEVFNSHQIKLYNYLEFGPDNENSRKNNRLNERAFWMIYSLPMSTLKNLVVDSYQISPFSFLVDDSEKLFLPVKNKFNDIQNFALNSYPIKNLIKKIGISSNSPYYATLIYNLFISYTIINEYQTTNEILDPNKGILFTELNVERFTNKMQKANKNTITFLLNHSEFLLNSDLIFKDGVLDTVINNIQSNELKYVPEFQNKSFDEFITNSKPEKILKGNTTNWNEFHFNLDSFLQKLYGTDFNKILNSQTGSKNGVSIDDFLKKSYELPDEFNSGYSNSCRSLFK